MLITYRAADRAVTIGPSPDRVAAIWADAVGFYNHGPRTGTSRIWPDILSPYTLFLTTYDVLEVPYRAYNVS